MAKGLQHMHEAMSLYLKIHGKARCDDRSLTSELEGKRREEAVGS